MEFHLHCLEGLVWFMHHLFYTIFILTWLKSSCSSLGKKLLLLLEPQNWLMSRPGSWILLMELLTLFMGEDWLLDFSLASCLLLPYLSSWSTQVCFSLKIIIYRFPFVCISIGLTIGKVPTVGVVFNPIMNEVITFTILVLGCSPFLDSMPHAFKLSLAYFQMLIVEI